MTTAKWNMGGFSDSEKIQRIALGLRLERDFGGVQLEELKNLEEVIFISQTENGLKRKWDLGRNPKLMPVDNDPDAVLSSFARRTFYERMVEGRPKPKDVCHSFEKAPGDKWWFKGKDLAF